MAAVEIILDQETLALEAGETLLDGATRLGLHIPSSCGAGVCQSCLVQVEEGSIPTAAQIGLSAQQKLQNFALACQLRPVDELCVRRAGKVKRFLARVQSHQLFPNGVLRLRLQLDNYNYFPGQFASLWRDENCGRPYSIASVNHEGFVEFHIKKHEHGRLSRWLHDHLEVGATVELSEARGECFYEASLSSKPLLLVGTGTGLAPLYAIIRDALGRGHPREIALFVCAHSADQHYLVEELNSLAAGHDNFSVTYLVRDDGLSGFYKGDVLPLIKERFSSLQGWCVFLCGAPSLVKQLQKVCFLSGASMSDIHADPFLTNPR